MQRTPGSTPAPNMDLGLEVVGHVRQRSQWARCTEWPRGFTCLPLGVVQRVWSEPSCDTAHPTAWRVQVRTGFLAGFDGSPRQLGALPLDMAHSALGAVVRGQQQADRLQLASTLHVHRGNAAWAADMIASVALLQVYEARRLALTSALLGLGAAPDVAVDAAQEPAPVAVGRDEFEDLAAPTAAGDLWAWQETQGAIGLLRSFPGVRAHSTRRGLVATFHMAHPSLDGGLTMLEIDTTAQRPGLGRGLSVLLVPPSDGDVLDALALNELEIGPVCLTDLLGGWLVRDGMLQHSAFFPEGLRTPGLLARIVLAATRRVEWFASRRLPH